MFSGIIYSTNPINRMYWSVKQCARNSLIKNKFNYLRKVNNPTELINTCAFVKLPEKHFSYCRSPFHWQSSLTCSIVLSQRKDLSWCSKTYCTTKESNNVKADKSIDSDSNLTTVQRLKKLWKDYRYILFSVHVFTSAIWYGSFYYMVVSGLDIPQLLLSLGAPESWSESLKNSQAGNFVLAYALYKLATPLRYTVTAGGTTLAVKVLRDRGWFQPTPATQQIKQICRDQKEALKELKATYQDKMQVTKDEFLKSKKAMTQQFLEVQDGLHNSIRETREEMKSIAEDYKFVGKMIVKGMKRNQNHSDGNK